jgi:hypothetical protein
MVGTHGALHVLEVASERLCQDLSELMGSLHQTFSTAVEGSPLDPELRERALEAARTLMTRLQLRCAAWGPVDGPASLARIQVLACGLPEQVTLDVSGVGQSTVFPASTSRILLNLLLVTADGLPSGGVVRLAGAADDLFIRIDGPHAAWPAGMALCLANEAEARTALNEPRSMQMAMTALLAHAAGIRLSVVLGPTSQTMPAIVRLGGSGHGQAA